MSSGKTRLQQAVKELKKAQDARYSKTETAITVGAVGSAYVAVDGNIAKAQLPSGTTGEIEVVNTGRPASAVYAPKSGGGVTVVRNTSSVTGSSSDAAIAQAIAIHKTETDPHPIYLTQTEANALYVSEYGTAQYQVPVTGASPYLATYTELSTFAGNGLTFGTGYNVGAGTLISVAADTVGLANGSAQYQVPVTGATPFTPAYAALSSFAGAGIGFSGGQFVVGVANTGATGLTQETDLIRLTSSSAPTGASILASDSGGGLTLQDITVASDTDTEIILARGKFYSSITDNMMLAHFDHANSTDYSLRATAAAQTLINAASGQSINHRINNADIMVMTAGGLNLSAGNLSITGGGDLTVGANIFFVDNSGNNVGINCAPDPQFDLDVLGNFRAQGFIVGKHAIQISDAVAIYHWDGVSTNTTGETRSHLGQVPTSEVNAPEFVAGKFGKAISIGPARTAYLANPSFETNTTGWTASSATLTRTGKFSAHGGYCGMMMPSVSGGFIWSATSSNLFSGNAYTFSVWLRCDSGTVTVRLGIQNNAGGTTYATQDVTVSGIWKMFSVAATVAATEPARAFVQNVTNTKTIYVDGAQVTNGATVTSYISATRSGDAYEEYASQGVDPNTGTLMLWVKPYIVNALGYIFVCGTSTTDRIQLVVSSTGKARAIVADGDISGTTTLTANNWAHLAVTWNNGSVKVFVNGTLEASGSYTAFSTINANYRFGNNSSSQPCEIDDVVIRSVESSAAEIRAIYESNAPVFAETSSFQFRAGSGLVWADAEGLWMYDSSGTAILGVSAVDSKSWGGRTINTGDFSLGQYGSSNGGWLLFDQIDTSSKPSLTMGYATTEAFRFDASGNKITGALTVTGSLTAGSATVDANGVGIGADSSFAWSTAAGFQNVTVTTGRAYRFTGATQNNFLGMTGNYASNTSTLALVNENETASGASKSSRIILDARAITDDAISGVGTSSVIMAASQWAPNQGGIVNVAKISMTVASASSIDITLDSKSAEIKGGLKYAVLAQQSSTPSVYGSANAQALVYFKGTKLIVMYDDGTVRYKYLDLAGTGTTWVHTTSAP